MRSDGFSPGPASGRTEPQHGRGQRYRPAPPPGLSADGRGTFIHLKLPQGAALLPAPRLNWRTTRRKRNKRSPTERNISLSDTLDNLERELNALASGAVG